jgi:hypothetical protein
MPLPDAGDFRVTLGEEEKERIKRLTNDLDAMRMLVKTAVLRGDPGGAFNRSMKIVDAGKAEAVDLNNLAWYSLFFDRDGESV